MLGIFCVKKDILMWVDTSDDSDDSDENYARKSDWKRIRFFIQNFLNRLLFLFGSNDLPFRIVLRDPINDQHTFS